MVFMIASHRTNKRRTQNIITKGGGLGAGERNLMEEGRRIRVVETEKLCQGERSRIGRKK